MKRILLLASLFIAPAFPPRAAADPCCKHCNPQHSKACGDSCIALERSCHKLPGCACDG